MTTQGNPELGPGGAEETRPPIRRLLSLGEMLEIVEAGGKEVDALMASADPFNDKFDLRSVQMGVFVGAQIAEHKIRRKISNSQGTEITDGNS